jgi:TatA/E family protein of Tat protein translocase
MGSLGMQEILIILVIALLVIGPEKLPDLAKALGRAFAEFKRATEDLKKNLDVETLLRDDEAKKEKGVPDSESPQVQLGRAFAEIKRTAEDLKKGLDIENILKGDEVKQGKGALDLESHQQQLDFQKRSDVTEIKKDEEGKKDLNG